MKLPSASSRGKTLDNFHFLSLYIIVTALAISTFISFWGTLSNQKNSIQYIPSAPLILPLYRHLVFATILWVPPSFYAPGTLALYDLALSDWHHLRIIHRWHSWLAATFSLFKSGWSYCKIAHRFVVCTLYLPMCHWFLVDWSMPTYQAPGAMKPLSLWERAPHLKVVVGNWGGRGRRTRNSKPACVTWDPVTEQTTKHSLLEHIKQLIYSLFIKMNYMVLFDQEGQEPSQVLGGENPNLWTALTLIM